MCGIVGVAGPVSRDQASQQVDAMNKALAHRGPDDSGAWSTEGFGFGMRRLSIIDLETGGQPMWFEDRTGIVYNGEIYNYRELRNELRDLGYTFQTTSDTEVALKAYDAYGPSCVERFNGMFAFAIFDGEQESLFLARDRLGIKPLYLAENDGVFCFASEAKALVEAGVGGTLDRQSFHHYLTLRYIPSPRTAWEGIEKLPPGTSLTVDLKTGVHKEERYWELSICGDRSHPSRHYAEEFEELFLDSVEKRLEAADVPVGVLLSGGLDSSAVAAAAVEVGHENLHTYNVAFEEGGEYSEAAYARLVSDHIGSRHHEITIDQETFIELLPDLVRATDDPLADLSAIPYYLVCTLARRDVKAVLSGEGSDEILAGYDMERLARNLAVLRVLAQLPKAGLDLAARFSPDRYGPALRAISENGWSNYFQARGSHMTQLFSEGEKSRLWASGDRFEATDDLIRSWYEETKSSHPLDQLQQVYSRSWLVEDLLMKADKMSMATSLEVRVPFLDHRLVEWASALPIRERVGSPARGYTSKRILRGFAKHRLPNKILDRPKQGFPVPAYRWLQEDLGAWAEDQLTGPGARLPQMLRPEELSGILERARAGAGDACRKAWLLLILETWLREWT